MWAQEKKPLPKYSPIQQDRPQQSGAALSMSDMASLMGNQAMLAYLSRQSEQSKPADAGKPLSDSLREKFERKSGVPLDDVRVHYNSDKPEQLGAEAYAQGNEIHIGPGNEQDLEHEVGHVVQQKQGLVHKSKHTDYISIVNDDALEAQATEKIIHRGPVKSILDPSVIQCCGRKRLRSSSRYSDTEHSEEECLTDDEREDDTDASVKNCGYKYGAGQSLKFIFGPTTLNAKKGMSKAAILHGDRAVRPKSYTGLRDKQHMRWLASTMSVLSGAKTEIQCYHEGNTIYISANTKEDIDKLQKIIDAKKDFNLASLKKGVKPLSGKTVRQKRHIEKMRLLLAEGTNKTPKIKLVPASADQADGLHAERRIQQFLAKEAGQTVDNYFLDYRHLGGLRRPCLVCHNCVLKPGDRKKVHSGPYWSSASANLDLTKAQKRRVAFKLCSSDTLTYATKKPHGSVVMDCDTDSDSDVEELGEPQKKKRSVLTK